MSYADWAYYTGTYGGSAVTEAEWPRLAMQASACLDAITCGRLARGAQATEAVRMATCAAAEALARCAAAEADANDSVKSENTDGYGVSYATAAERAEARSAAVDAAIALYLPPGDPLRYRGVHAK